MGPGLAESRTQKAVAARAEREGIKLFEEDPIPLGQRPWVTSFAPRGPEWSRQLLGVFDEGLLTFEEIGRDIQEGLIRPSIIYQVKKRIEDPFRFPPAAFRMDDSFLPPELKVSDAQRKALSRRDRRQRVQWFFKKNRDGLVRVLSGPLKRLRRSERLWPFFSFLKELISPFAYRWSYARWRFFSRRGSSRLVSPEYDWVFVLKRKSSDRRVEDACAKILNYLPGKHCVYFAANAVKLPRAKNYCFPEVSFFVKCLKAIPALWEAKTVVFYDGPKIKGKPEGKEILFALSRASKIDLDIQAPADLPDWERVACALERAAGG